MDDTLDRLPSTYAAYLRLERAGVAPAVIAAQLEVAVEAIPLLAELAHAKLAQTHRRPPIDTDPSEPLP